METSTKYGFYLPSSDTDDIADINQISDNFRKIDTDVQEKLESGKNLKTINNQSLLGSGNIEIQGGSGKADQKYSPKSTNAQSGKAVAEAVSGKMDKFGTVDDFDKSVTMSGRTIYNSSKKSSLTLDGLGAALSTEGVLILNVGTQIAVNDKPIKNLATPDGTDPTQAANVEFVKRARNMRLLIDHIVTEEQATNGGVFSYTADTNKQPFNFDAIHVSVEIPNAVSASKNLSFYLNGSMESKFCLSFVVLNSNATGTYWADAEKISSNRWRTTRANIHANDTSRTMYAGYDMGEIDTIYAIRVVMAVSGARFRIWGRDAI